ncbi:MAG TPA: QueT transporter family protein [Candidatus Acidoferrum sp.]|nr:QueT transporter family protein [Candidatus Acidoferrum sp.]
MKLRTKDIALIAIYAALYAALVVELGGISYGIINFRIADAMVAAVPLLGIPGVLGHTLGVFISNIPSPLGLIDLLNTIPSFAMSFVIYYVYKKTRNDYTVIATCAAYSVVLGITVGAMLSPITHIPLLLSMLYVVLGNLVATVLIGWPLFKLLKRTGIFQNWYQNQNQTKSKMEKR